MINDGLVASQFQLIAAKLLHIIIIVWGFMLKIVSYLGSSFRALKYRSTNCDSMPLSDIMHNMAMHVQAKAFAGTRSGTMFHKTFPIYFIVKMIVPTQKIRF